MTDPSVERGFSPKNDDNIEDAVVVDETVAAADESPAATPLVEPIAEPANPADTAVYDDSTLEAEVEPMAEPAVAAEPEIVAEPEPEVVADPEPAVTSAAAASAEPRVVYVTAPTPPKVAGNRGFAVFIALASTLVFALVFALAVAIISAAATGRVALAFVQAPSFYVPVAFFALGAIVIAGWAAHVFSSIIVGLVVYFGTIGALLLINGVIQNTPEQAQAMFAGALVDPLIIAAGLIGREVSLWTGALVAKRGRKVTQRNSESRAKWEAELAEKTAAQR